MIGPYLLSRIRPSRRFVHADGIGLRYDEFWVTVHAHSRQRTTSAVTVLITGMTLGADWPPVEMNLWTTSSPSPFDAEMRATGVPNSRAKANTSKSPPCAFSESAMFSRTRVGSP